MIDRIPHYSYPQQPAAAALSSSASKTPRVQQKNATSSPEILFGTAKQSSASKQPAQKQSWGEWFSSWLAPFKKWFGGTKTKNGTSSLEVKSTYRERFADWRRQQSLKLHQRGEQAYISCKKTLSQWMLIFAAIFSVLPIPASFREYLLRNYFFSPQKVSSSYSLKPELRQKILDVRFHPKGTNTTELNGWYLKAHNGKPTVIFSHGRDCNISHLEPIMEALSQKGYGVFVYDYPGYGRSEGLPSEEALYEASVAACKFAASDEVSGLGVPYSKQILMGHSLGGAVAVDTARKFADSARTSNPQNPKRIFNRANKAELAGQPQALILVNTFTDVKEGLFAKKQEFNTYLQKLFNEERLPLKFDSKEKIKRVSMPILVLHGDQDPLIKPAIGQKLASNATSTQHKEFRTLSGAKHKLKGEACQQVAGCLDNFLKNLPSDVVPSLTPLSSSTSSLNSLTSA